MIHILNLQTGEHIMYSSTPIEAVVAASRQALGDFNTWGYPQYYESVKETDKCYIVDNFCVLKEPNDPKPKR